MTRISEKTELAFPRGPIGEDCDRPYGHQDGMTLRDYFAARALQSIMLDHDARVAFPQTIAGRAYDYADAMLAARKGGAA